MPSEALPGVHRMNLRVWRSEIGAPLWITETVLPLARRAVEIRTRTTVRPSQTDRSVTVLSRGAPRVL